MEKPDLSALVQAVMVSSHGNEMSVPEMVHYCITLCVIFHCQVSSKNYSYFSNCNQERFFFRWGQMKMRRDGMSSCSGGCCQNICCVKQLSLLLSFRWYYFDFILSGCEVVNDNEYCIYIFYQGAWCCVRQVMNEDGLTSSVRDKILTINVKKGWKPGTRITFPQEGDQGPNNIPGIYMYLY